MTEQQRKGIEILNNLKAEKFDDGTPIISDDDYFFLLSFIVDKQNEVQYVPQIVPTIWPTNPISPLYGQRWEITCSATENDFKAE
jgi:hypothetical protein